MNVRSLFPTPLIVTEVETGSSLIAELRRIILAEEEKSQGVARSNEGGWQSADDLLSWAGPAGEALMAGIAGILNGSTATFENGALQRTPLDWKFQAWANVNRSGHANAIHFHPGSYWSGTFYVDDGGIDGREDLGGAIEFKDPRGPLPLMYAPAVKMTFDGCVNAGLAERLYPRTGQLILFPSWLAHSVLPYTGTGTRISVAFNCSLW
jgi:uncharacterized protein (TIGR02466 family)